MFHGQCALLSVGNLVANRRRDRPSTYDGVIATVTFSMEDGVRFRAAEPVAHPTWYDREAARVRLVYTALADPWLVTARTDLTASLTRTKDVLDAYVAVS